MRPAERITRDKQKVAKRQVRHAQGRDVVGSGMLQNVATCMVQYGGATLPANLLVAGMSTKVVSSSAGAEQECGGYALSSHFTFSFASVVQSCVISQH
jgi:hypothetical protein